MIQFNPCLGGSLIQNKSKKILFVSSIIFLGCQSSINAAPLSFSSQLQQMKPAQLVAQRDFRYRVFVNGNSQLLLEQVQKIERDAFPNRDSRGNLVIQAGAFDDRRSARKRVEELENIGIQARIQESTDRATSFNRIRRDDNQWDFDSTGYFVVIPAPQRDLQDIEEQVRRLALREDQNDPGVQWRNQPRGYHVIVGPFEDREIAERWNRYLKDFGLGNARVYYGD